MERPPSVLALADDAGTSSRVRDLVQADPVALLEIAAEIAHGKGAWPAEAVTRGAHEEAARIAGADTARVRAALERALMGRDVDLALEWLHQVSALSVLFPELEATVNLVQEEGRQHKDVWAHTKQVVKQAVRRPSVRWAALFHDIGKVPTRTFTDKGVHFHGHAEVGARMFDRIAQRIAFDRDERRTIRFLVKHHLRSNQYSDTWTDSAVRRFHREMAAHLVDLLDLSRADITSKRPGRRKQLLEQISALSDRIDHLAAEDARLPPLPGGVGVAIMDAFHLPPSKQIGDLKKALEQAIDRGEIEPRREDAYYVAWLARSSLVPGLDPETARRLAAAGGLPEGAPDPADPEREPDGHDGDPDRPREGVLDCAADPEHSHSHD
jgi:poly(A) polymerase